MRRVTFDYPNTCPQIDKAIGQAESEIEQHIGKLLDEACPLLPPEARNRYAAESANTLYRALEDIFEGTRQTNEDMRREAERQIADLQDQITSLEHDVRALS